VLFPERVSVVACLASRLSRRVGGGPLALLWSRGLAGQPEASCWSRVITVVMNYFPHAARAR
jgi:hypothetical protein